MQVRSRKRREKRRRGWAQPLEPLEPRQLFNSLPFFGPRFDPSSIFEELQRFRSQHTQPGHGIAAPVAELVNNLDPLFTSPQSSFLSPAQMTSLYGLNSFSFGNIMGTGAGQTIAIVDAFDDPNALSDLRNFDAAFGLPNPPSFQRLNENGVAGSYPANASTKGGNWGLEESLDIEWSHVVAPQANIILVEAGSASTSDLITVAANTAANLPGVSVVSMSFGGSESSGETVDDQFFTTPTNHQGVTFVASTGDSGAPGGYPAFSPNVLAVGGTQFNSTASYTGETGWSDSGGGISTVESQPSYQNGIVTQSATMRTIPDVAFDANTPVNIYDSLDFGSSPWAGVIGTSLAAPMWAGVIAIVNQGRALASLPTLDGPSQTLPNIYSLPSSDFNDITSGNNGFAAGPGYDLVTGRGTPIVSLLIPDLAGIGTVSGNIFQDNNGNGINDGTDGNLANTTVYIDSNNNGVFDSGSTTTVSSGTLNQSIPDRNFNGRSSTLNISGTNDPITNISITLNITHPRDADLQITLTSPDGTSMLLVKNNLIGANLSGTVVSGTSNNAFASGSAPYTATFSGAGSLTSFNGKTGAAVNGGWTLKVVDSVGGKTGTLNNWSLSVTTGEQSAVTDSNGNYAFPSLALGTYTLRQIVPMNTIQILPGPGILPPTPPAPLSATVNSRSILGENFADFPELFSTMAASANFYLTLDPTGNNLEIFQSATPTGTPAFTVAKGDVYTLAFDELGAGDNLYVDYTNGSPVPAQQVNFVGSNTNADNLEIIGQHPTDVFNMTDTQVALGNGPAILFQSVSTLSLVNMTADYTGSFSGFQNLFIDVTTVFNWL